MRANGRWVDLAPFFEPLKMRELRRWFIEFAKEHPQMTFKVTRVSCGLAGYSDKQMAPLFIRAPKNCQLPIEWKPLLSGVDKNGKEGEK
jgi:hypothetical protein